jgi:hypothetical protein
MLAGMFAHGSIDSGCRTGEYATWEERERAEQKEEKWSAPGDLNF